MGFKDDDILYDDGPMRMPPVDKQTMIMMTPKRYAHLQARLAEAERLLGALADMPYYIEQIDSGTFYYECPACGNAAKSTADIAHRPDCGKEQARAFLAQDGAR